MASPLSEILAAVFTGVPALAVALIGWAINRRDTQAEVQHLREANLKLTEALHLSLYGHARKDEA